MQQGTTPPDASTNPDARDADVVRPEPQSLSLVPPAAAVNNAAADSETMDSPQPEMLAPGDALYPSLCLSTSDCETLMLDVSPQQAAQHFICLLHVCCQQEV